MLKRLLLFLLTGWACHVHALIIYNNGANDDSSYTTTNGLPQGMDAMWDSVVFLSRWANSFDASGVYLGNGFFLTAQHVTALYAGQSAVFINNVPYTLDIQFGTGGMMSVADIPGVTPPVDLRIFKVLSPPALPAATLNRSKTETTVGAAYLVGCGQGKGTPIVGQGWAWGTSNATRARRWGAAVIAGPTTADTTGSCLYSRFSPSHGTHVASAAQGDSGSGMFQHIGGVWVLSGITAAVTTSGHSYHTPPDSTLYVRIADYADAIASAITDTLIGTVAIPNLWLRTYFPSAPFSSYAALAGQTASNGLNTIAECYVAGLNPTNATSRFRATITLTNNTPYIAWSPDLRPNRTYEVQGKTNLSESTWGSTNSATRFFKVKVFSGQ